MRVLISGGGIAGLTLAYWLNQYDISPVVIEQATGIRRDGYGIDFYGTGYDVAERMDLIERLQPLQIPFDYVAYIDKEGKPTAKLDIAFMKKIMNGKYMGLMHETLQETLYEALDGQVEVRFGRSLANVRTEPNAVFVTFNDGTTESFDLLVGADGVHSQTRKLVFGPEEQFGRFLGYVIACYRLPDRYGIGRTWKMYLEPGRLAGVYAGNGDGDIFALFMYQANEMEHLPRKQRLPRLRQVFAGMGWITKQLLDDIPDPDAIFMDTVMQIQMPTWHHDRVALVGDACDCPTLISGQGASLAMGGAYLLAKALHETANYQDAFHRYEQQMHAYVQAQQKGARSFARTFLPGTPLGLLVQQVMLKIVLREAFIGLLRRQFGGESILAEPPKDARRSHQQAREKMQPRM